jgi:hypothetical protein
MKSHYNQCEYSLYVLVIEVASLRFWLGPRNGQNFQPARLSRFFFVLVWSTPLSSDEQEGRAERSVTCPKGGTLNRPTSS